MSNSEIDPKAPAIRAVKQVHRGQPTSDGAGVRLNRLIGGAALPEVDPFLLLDEFRSDNASDYIAGFPEHPHRGFETVTYMLAGRMRHGDNKGHTGRLDAGSVQWMTAGRGILHSEMPEQENGLMWGFQLWVNLPAKDKMTTPRYQEIPPERIPVAELAGGITAKVVAGKLDGVEGPIGGIATDPSFFDFTLPKGARLDLPVPARHSVFVYPFEGDIAVGEPAKEVARGGIALLGDGERVVLAAPKGQARALLVAGRPLHEPVARYGPFVMNTESEIRQAIVDFQAGRF